MDYAPHICLQMKIKIGALRVSPFVFFLIKLIFFFNFVEFQRREKRKAFIIIVKRLHTGGMHARLYRDLQRHNRRK